MEKSVFTAEYNLLLTYLRDARARAGLTQQQVASRLGVPQSFVSKCEQGQRRIDAIELLHFCRILGISFAEFAAILEKALPE